MLRTAIAAGALLAAMTMPAFAEGDPAKGERVFNKCKTCHAVGEDAKNKVGPVLNGIVGAAAGQNADFKYSKALLAKAEEGLVWDGEALTAYLANPKAFLKGTKMAFAGLRKEDDIADVIAYLSTFE